MSKHAPSRRRSTRTAPVFSRVTAIACAASAWMAVALAAGCTEVVSLGSGDGDPDEDAPSIPIHPWLPEKPPPGDLPFDGFPCKPGLTTDLDGDGYTAVEGDCNDCDPDMGPNAVEMPTFDGELARDEDCDGHIDEVAPACDSDLPIASDNAELAANAMDVCRDAKGGKWGLQHATWVTPGGATPPTSWVFEVGHGNIDSFGPNVLPRRGARMLALSSGTARRPGDADYGDPRAFDKGLVQTPPNGFPISTPECPEVESGAPHDGIALELALNTPQNAAAFAFDFNYYTYELPDEGCKESNDLFLALVTPPPPFAVEGNIAFDATGNLISVNTVSLEACSCAGGPPCDMGGRTHACSLGSAPLKGTGFGADLSKDGDRGATGWLTATSPVERSSTVKVRLTIYDADNGFADSTVLIDNFRWLPYAPQIPRSR
ncbi:MAG: hypothetical protein R3F14_23240 [Polyangiaceae bacterium]